MCKRREDVWDRSSERIRSVFCDWYGMDKV